MDFERLLSEYKVAIQWIDDPGKPVHLLGIGGVGMAGLALMLQARGYHVSGCDLNANPLTRLLRDRGIEVLSGHDPAHIHPDVRWTIRSAAVPEDHPEVTAVRAAGIPLFRRGVVLPALLRTRHAMIVAGTHGKTTTTGFIAQIFHRAGKDIGYCIGGIIPTLNPGPAAVGGENILVAEADESDGTLSLYEPETLVINNIDFDHMENFADKQEFEACFRRVIERTRGRLIFNREDPVAARLAAVRSDAISFGFHSRSDYRATGIKADRGRVRFMVSIHGEEVGRVELPAPGIHNVSNALAALAAAVENGLAPDDALKGLTNVGRPRRRFETIAEHHGCRIISDYAHHPTELRALMQTAREERPGRILIVFQPHRYTRTLALGAGFPAACEGADAVVLLPVYAASESPLSGGSAADLYARFREGTSRRNVCLAQSLDQVVRWLEIEARRDDMILIAGAGTVEQIALTLAKSRQWPAEPGLDRLTVRRRRLQTVSQLPPDRVTAGRMLANHTTLGVGGAADWMVQVRSVKELTDVINWAVLENIPVRVLGGGSNVLASDLGVRGVVIRLGGAGFATLSLEADGSVLAGAAVPLARLAKLSRSGRVAGFGFLTGIPGTVGGAVRGNAGAWGAAIGDRVICIHGVDAAGRPWVLQRAELEFGYRECVTLRDRGVMTAIRLQPLSEPDPREPERMAQYDNRRAWMRGKRTAGSVFRNPEGGCAWKLLRAAGCAGLRVGGAVVCEEHANVIACETSARASDVLALMQIMQERVLHHGGMVLTPEIHCWT